MNTTPNARPYLSSCDGERTANSTTPRRNCSACSGGEPSSLLGKILNVTSFFVRSAMRFVISIRATWFGCCVSPECASLNSLACTEIGTSKRATVPIARAMIADARLFNLRRLRMKSSHEAVLDEATVSVLVSLIELDRHDAHPQGRCPLACQ